MLLGGLPGHGIPLLFPLWLAYVSLTQVWVKMDNQPLLSDQGSHYCKGKPGVDQELAVLLPIPGSPLHIPLSMLLERCDRGESVSLS